MLEFIIAFYASGVGLAMWKLWFPSLKTIKEIAPYSIVARQQVIATMVVFVLFTLFLPVIAIAILFDDKGYKFTESFLKGAMNKNDDKKRL